MRCHHFNFDKDRLFAYPDLPGFIAATGAKSFGNAWSFTGYPNSDRSNCVNINLEPVGEVRYVYLLQGDSLGTVLRSCLLKKLVPSANMERRNLGTGMHYRNGNYYHLSIIGPYEMR